MADTRNPLPPALELRAVVKRFGAGTTEVRALTDVSLRVQPGELVAVMGPSGCGKSALLHLAGALEDPDAGHVLVSGRDLSTLSAAQRAMLRRSDVGDLRYDLEAAPGNNLSGTGPVVLLLWAEPDGGVTPLQLELILSGIALAFSLFVVGVSLALAAAESKDERDVLTIAGAPPGALARSAGARAWLLTSIGGAMAIPVGFLPVMVFSYTSRDQFADGRFPLVFPSRTGLLLLVAVPAVVALVALLASAAAQRLRPVRVSTATFE